jgi:glutamyl-tRNA reductase
MDLVIFGLNHRTAPLSIREQWAFSEKEARDALLGAQDILSASENLILSTCNRTEIYSLLPRNLDNGGAKNLEDLLDFFHRIKNFRREKNHSYFYTLRRKDAVDHLFRVAAGLDSMIVGEGQILRQIRDAFELARQSGSVGKVFLRLFPAAMKAGKRIRAETAISSGCITHGQAALRIARDQLGDLRGRNVLLLGAGKVTALVVKALREEGLSQIAVVSRSMEKALKFAADFSGEAFPIGDLPCLLEVSDLVISSTAATQPVVSAEMLEPVARKRRGRPLCVIDLAVPRDFDPACADVQGVSLFNVDHLNSVIQSNIQERLTEVPRAESIIQEEERSFFGQMNWIHLDPVIKHLVERFEAIRVAEVEKYIARIPPEHRSSVDALTAALLKKLLHFPIEKLKSLRDDEGLTPAEVSFLRRLFLSEPKEASPPET